METHEIIDLIESMNTIKKSIHHAKKLCKKDNKQKNVFFEVENIIDGIIRHLPKAVGISLKDMAKLVQMEPCYKCNCRSGIVVQWISKATGRGLNKYSVVCENCWNINTRSNDVGGGNFQQQRNHQRI